MQSRSDSHPKMTIKVSNKGDNKTVSPIHSPKDKRSTGAKRGNVHLSTSFMDALGPTTPEPLRKKSKKIASNGEKDKKKNSRGTCKKNNDLKDNDVLAGIYNTMDKATTTVSRSPSPPQGTITPPLYQFKMQHIEEPIRKRKIRFRDEHGGDLVEVKYFDVEEGERVNVYHLTPTEKRSLELGMESGMGKRMRSSIDVEEEPQETRAMKWRLIEVTGAADHPAGKGSIERDQEIRRQRTALEVLYIPGCSNDRISEPDHQNMRQKEFHKVRAIPLEHQYDDDTPSPSADDSNVALSPEYHSPTEHSPSPDRQSPYRDSPSPTMATSVVTSPPEVISAPEVPASKPTALPGHLQDILQGLRKNGILNGGTPATSISQQASPTIFGLQQQPSISQSFPDKYVPSHSYSQLHTPITSSAPALKILTNVDPHSVPSSEDLSDSMYMTHPSSVSTQIPRPVHTVPTQQLPMHGKPRFIKQCNSYATEKGCTWGDRCRFAHGDKMPNPAFQPTRGVWRGRGMGNRANAGVYNGPAL